jgi:3-oxoacyl-[acyl-carrier protein] reductase
MDFGEAGARVGITYRSDLAGAEETARRVGVAGGEGMVVPLELADEASVRAAVDRVVGRWGRVDVLVANAVEWGAPVWEPPPFEEVSPEGWRRMFETTVDGVFHVVRAVLPSMRERGWGRIVLLSSGSVEYGMPGGGAYGAAKAALHGLSRSLARELGPEGILVNVVMPGLVLTERNLRVVPEQVREGVAGESPSGRLSVPEDVAAAIVFLASGANGNTTGEILRVAGGM